jgi:hypothetical protein
MDLYNKLFKIYPELLAEDFSIRGPIVLQNDSDDKGDYIVVWNHPTLAKPTDEELA